MQPTRNGEGATAIGVGGPPGIPVRPLWQLAEPVVMPRGSPLQVGQYAAAKSDGTKSGSREGSGSGMGPFALLCFPSLPVCSPINPPPHLHHFPRPLRLAALNCCFRRDLHIMTTLVGKLQIGMAHSAMRRVCMLWAYQSFSPAERISIRISIEV